ncbi:MAG: XdhC family protein [Chloroflexi bacterium]|nr:XdhC family protein [Chloroflexota bacterium]
MDMEFWEQAAQWAAAGEPALLATVMAVNGQIPAPPGAHLIVTATATAGGLDGGAADSVVVPHLRAALLAGPSAYVERVEVPAEVAYAFGLMERGGMDLLIQPLSEFGAGLLEAVAAVVAAGESLALVTPVPADGKAGAAGRTVLARAGAVAGTTPDALREALPGLVSAGQAVRWTGADDAFFVDVVRPAEELIILGAMLTSETLCDLANRAGFRVTLVDDLGGATQAQYPAAAAIVGGDDPLAALMALPLTRSTYLVSMTTGHRFDLSAVRLLLRQPIRYLGMMGSRGRVVRTRAILAEEGFTPEEIARLHSPVGLNLGAETPFEIAVSVLAELIQVRRGNTGSVSDWAIPAPAAAG